MGKGTLVISFFCMFLVSAIAAIAECDEKDYPCQIRELQKENTQLEKKISALEACNSEDLACRIGQLEQQNAQQQEDLSNIYENLNFIYDVIEFIFCDALDLCGETIACYENVDCGTIEESEPYCENDAVVKLVTEDICLNPATIESVCDIQIDTEVLEQCEYGCENAACLPPPEEAKKVVFRTNIVGGDYYNSLSWAWIAIDRDLDESLEGYGVRARSSWSSARCGAKDACDGSNYPCVLALTPTNDKVIDYNNVDMVVVCDELNHKQVYYKLGDSDANDAELSSEPIEPYTSNKQEMLGVPLQASPWKILPPLPIPMSNMLAETVNGKLYAGAGGAGGSSNGRFFSFDFNTNSWSEKAQDSDIYGRASAAYNGKIYAFGGVAHEGPLTASSVYDPSANTWTGIAAMPTPRVAHSYAADLVNGKIYVIGGSDAYGPNDGTNAVEAYNPQTNTWEVKAPAPRNRQLHASASIGNKIYVFGGQDSSFDASVRTTYDVIDVYDTATNTWTTLSEKTPQKFYTAAAVSSNGKIYLVGGVKEPGLEKAGKIFEFDPFSRTFDEKTPMPTPRYEVTAVALDGVIYTIGGTTAPGSAADMVEAYSPALDD